MCESLQFAILSISESNNWLEAKNEFKIVNDYDTGNDVGHCLCGHVIRHVFMITNIIKNDGIEYKIVKICINHFERKDFDNYVKNLKRKTSDCKVCGKRVPKFSETCRKHIIYNICSVCKKAFSMKSTEEQKWKKKCYDCYKN